MAIQAITCLVFRSAKFPNISQSLCSRFLSFPSPFILRPCRNYGSHKKSKKKHIHGGMNDELGEYEDDVAPHDESKRSLLMKQSFKFINKDCDDVDSLDVKKLEAEFSRILNEFACLLGRINVSELPSSSHTLLTYFIVLFYVGFLDNVRVTDTRQGSNFKDTVLPELANVHQKNAMTLVVKPFDPVDFKKIQKSLHAFLSSNHLTSLLGLNLTSTVEDSASVLWLSLPKRSLQVKEQLLRLVASNAEDSRKQMRSLRQTAFTELKLWILKKDDVFRAEGVLQKSFDKYSKKIGDFSDAAKRDIQK